MSFAKIRPRRGTKTDWLEFNPVLIEGEFGVEFPDSGIGTGTCKFKFGDGINKWSDLEYAFEAENASSIDGGSVTIWNSIKFRRGTTDQWLLYDPVLDDGEPGFDITKGLMKIGDGEHPYSSLDYVGYEWDEDAFDFGDLGGWCEEPVEPDEEPEP